jgi:hypothetical protein
LNPTHQRCKLSQRRATPWTTISSRSPSSAPKGQLIVAQGNALGIIRPRFPSPERAA